MKKGFTSYFDRWGTPIYVGDVIELHSGYEGYWLVFKRNGKWMKKETRFGDVEPLEYSLSHGKVVKAGINAGGGCFCILD